LEYRDPISSQLGEGRVPADHRFDRLNKDFWGFKGQKVPNPREHVQA
jgi:hypothetical protein